jgi:hypothetical protein
MLKDKQRSPAGLQASMKQKISHLSQKTGKRSMRITTILIMERFVQRINQIFSEETVIKGGLALEFQLGRARTTKDIDITTKCPSTKLLERLQEIESYRPEPEDHLHFSIVENSKHPKITGMGVKYEGCHFKVEAKMAGKKYIGFGLDISFADPIFEKPLLVQGSKFFEAYGIARIQARIYPPSTHLAEKLHAYTCPQEEGRVNSRCKDLVDVLLLAELLDQTEASLLFEAFELTFSHRGTHSIPKKLARPPEMWKEMYITIKENDDLSWKDIEEVFLKSSIFLNPILEQRDVV